MNEWSAAPIPEFSLVMWYEYISTKYCVYIIFFKKNVCENLKRKEKPLKVKTFFFYFFSLFKGGDNVEWLYRCQLFIIN